MPQYSPTIDLSTLNGANGFRLDGIDAVDLSGQSVSGAGDVNGDGFDDLIIGAYAGDPGDRSAAGESYVVFGAAGGWSAALDLSTLDGANGFRLDGVNGNERSGFSVSSAGDINGDGFDDVVIGAWNAAPGGRTAAGQSYVVFGAAGGWDATIDLSALTGANGFRLDGIDANDWSGYSVAGAGDINGDGFDDLMIAAREADPGGDSRAGETYVVFGAASGWSASINLSTLNGANGFRLDGVDAEDVSAGSIASAGDVNGDGFDDLIIGAIGGDPGGDTNAGEAYVVFGAADGWSAAIDLSTLDGANGFRLDGIDAADWTGWSVASAGDVNADGFDDLIIGAAGAEVATGEVYVVFGAASGWAATLDLATLNGANGFRLYGITGNWADLSVAGAGDVNGDGFDDLIIGAPEADPGGDSQAGETFVVFGAAGGWSSAINLSTLDGNNGFRIDGVNAGDLSGRSVAGAGDVNGDGFADVVIGAPEADAGGDSNTGVSYVVFGSAPGEAVTRSGTAIANTIRGGAYNDTLNGLGGNDTLIGGGGNDTLTGGTGADSVYGEDGDDVLAVQMNHVASGDVFDGGAGEDTLQLTGDTSSFNFRTTTLVSIERLTFATTWFNWAQFWTSQIGAGLSASAIIDGTSGMDEVAFYMDSAGAFTIGFSFVGWSSDDHVAIYGSTGADTITASAYRDYLGGGDGDDILDGGAGDDYMDGQAGADTASYASVQSGVSVSLKQQGVAQNTIGAGLDTLVSIANLTGSAFNDTLAGDSSDNVINGGAGADAMNGDSGNDTFIVDNAGDTVTDGSGTDAVHSSVAFTLGANIENLYLTGSTNIAGTGNDLSNLIHGNSGDNVLSGGGSADTIYGNDGNDTLYGGDFGDLLVGGAGADIIDGGAGNDTLVGGDGDDTYVIDSSGDFIGGETSGVDTAMSSVTWYLSSGASTGVENLTLTGVAAIAGYGTSSANILIGNGSANLLDSAGGADTMAGGGGDDVYVLRFDSAGTIITELAGEGVDRVDAYMTYTLEAEIENLTLLGGSAINGSGNALSNILIGNVADNTLDGGAGADSLIGGAGNDAYVADNVGDTITELAGEGTDSVASSVTFTLSNEVENLTLVGAAAINGSGNALANTITGNTAANRLDGGAGADALIGDGGNDTYVVDDAGDVVTETAGQGTDTVEAYISYTLGAEVENLLLVGAGTLTGIGNALANTITGNSFANLLEGKAGADTLDGGAGNDTLAGGDGNDLYYVDAAGDVVSEALGEGTDEVRSLVSFTLGANVENLTLIGAAEISATGNALANTLIGNVANNILDGAGGADKMLGGAGDDFYFVDNAGDEVTEVSGQGTDVVLSNITYTLTDNVENLTLAETGAIDATGNALANTLRGNSSANTLDGAGGADTLIGWTGDDSYVIDNAGDTVVESNGGGTDTVLSTITYALGAYIENLTLTGIAAINATGNSLANALTGNDAANTLDGGAGADVLAGGGGNDIYVVDNAGDTITELTGGGTDLVAAYVSFALSSEVENLTLLGTNAINGTGNAVANVINGNSAANMLTGGGGNDTLFGGAGVDTAVFAVDSSAASWHRNVDGSWTVLSSEGMDQLSGVEALAFNDRTVFLDSAPTNFSGDGTSDVLFRRSDGIVASWSVTGATVNSTSFLPAAGAEWTPLSVGDIGGDGRDDVLWRRDDGTIYAWIMNGGALSGAVALTGIGPEWSFLGAGDFNGDFTDDLAWRRNDGVVYVWTMQGNAVSAAGAPAAAPLNYNLEGIGDFNGDGREDFLWRNSATGQTVIWEMNGAAIESSGQTSIQLGLDWTIIGVGDTDGDGRDDIILQRVSNGTVRVWTMDGLDVVASANAGSASPAQWSARDVGDYNGDGQSDILWQRADGTVYVWFLDGASVIGSGAMAGVGPEWSIIPGG